MPDSFRIKSLQSTVGSAEWIRTEKDNIRTLLEQELEDVVFPVQHELEWLNECLRNIGTADKTTIEELVDKPAAKTDTKTPKSTRRPLGAFSATIHDNNHGSRVSHSPLKPSENGKKNAQSAQDADAAKPPFHGVSDDENIPPPQSNAHNPLSTRQPLGQLSTENAPSNPSFKDDDAAVSRSNSPRAKTPERDDKSAIDIYSDAYSSPFDPLTPGVTSYYGRKSSFDFGFVPAPEQLDDSGESGAENDPPQDKRGGNGDENYDDDDHGDDSGGEMPRAGSMHTTSNFGDNEETDEKDTTPKASQVGQNLKNVPNEKRSSSHSPETQDVAVDQPAETPSPRPQSHQAQSSPFVPMAQNTNVSFSQDASKRNVARETEPQSIQGHDEASVSPLPSPPPQPQSNHRTSKSTTQLLHERISMLGQSRPSRVSRITKSISATVGNPTPSQKPPSPLFAEPKVNQETAENGDNDHDNDGHRDDNHDRIMNPVPEESQLGEARELDVNPKGHEHGLAALVVGSTEDAEHDAAEDKRNNEELAPPIHDRTTSVEEPKDALVFEEKDQFSPEKPKSPQQHESEHDEAPSDEKSTEQNALDDRPVFAQHSGDDDDAEEYRIQNEFETESSPAKARIVEEQPPVPSNNTLPSKLSSKPESGFNDSKRAIEPSTPSALNHRPNHGPVNQPSATSPFKRPMSRMGSALKTQARSQQLHRETSGVSRKPPTSTKAPFNQPPGRPAPPEHRRPVRPTREVQKKPKPAPVSIRVGTLSSRRIPLSNNDNNATTTATTAGNNEAVNDLKRTPKPLTRTQQTAPTPVSAASARPATLGRSVTKKGTTTAAAPANGFKGPTSSMAAKTKPPISSSSYAGVHKNRSNIVGQASSTASAQKRKGISAQQRFLQQQHQQEERRQRQQQQKQEQEQREKENIRRSDDNDVQRLSASTTTTAAVASDGDGQGTTPADDPQTIKKMQALQAIERRRMENAAKKLELQQNQRPQQPLRPHLQKSALFNPPSPATALSPSVSQTHKPPASSHPSHPNAARPELATTPVATTHGVPKPGIKRPLEASAESGPRVVEAKKPSAIYQSDGKRRKTGDEEQGVFEKTQVTTSGKGIAAGASQSGVRKQPPQPPMPTIRAVNTTNTNSDISMVTKEKSSLAAAGQRAFPNQKHAGAVNRPYDTAKYVGIGDKTNIIHPQPQSQPLQIQSTKARNKKSSKSPAAAQYPHGETIQLPEIATDEEDSDGSDADGDDDGNSNASGNSPSHKMVPDWVKPHNLHQLLVQQDGNDGEEVFGPAPSPHIEEIFKDSKNRHRFRDRTSSANWNGPDGLTQEEIDWDNAARERLKRNGGWVFETQ